MAFASNTADWIGYELVWSGWVDWLGGRDPLFRWLIDGAQALFGPSGYEDFRLATLGAELVGVAWLALRMPAAGGIALVATLTLGVVAQLREGLALITALCAAAPLLTRRKGAILALAGAVVAAMLHMAAAVFVVLLLIAPALGSARAKTEWALTGASALVGACLAAFVVANADEVRLAVAYVGVGVEAQPSGGLLKTLYWAAMSGSVLLLRAALIAGAADASKMAGGWLRALACGALPLALIFCFGLVAVQFPTPAVTTLGIRLLLLLMDAGLVAAALRGRIGLPIVGVAFFMLADAIRVLVGSSPS